MWRAPWHQTHRSQSAKHCGDQNGCFMDVWRFLALAGFCSSRLVIIFWRSWRPFWQVNYPQLWLFLRYRNNWPNRTFTVTYPQLILTKMVGWLSASGVATANCSATIITRFRWSWIKSTAWPDSYWPSRHRTVCCLSKKYQDLWRSWFSAARISSIRTIKYPDWFSCYTP